MKNNEKKETIHHLLPILISGKVGDSPKNHEILRADKINNQESKLPLPAKGASLFLRLICLALLFLGCLAAGILNFSSGQNQALYHHHALSLPASEAALAKCPPSSLQTDPSQQPPRILQAASSRHLSPPRKALSQPAPLAPASPQQSEQSEDIAITISYPQTAMLTTPYRQIFVEGKIQAKHGLQRIEFNGQELFNKAVLDKLIRQGLPKLEQGGRKASARPDRDLSKLQKTLSSSLESYSLYYLNQICSLQEGGNRLELVVEDNAGHTAARRFDIYAASTESAMESASAPGPAAPEPATPGHGPPASASPEMTNSANGQHPTDSSQDRHPKGSLQNQHPEGNPQGQHQNGSLEIQGHHRMILALLPPAKKAGAGVDDLADYIYHRLGESITRQTRFRLVERGKLPWLLIEKAIQTPTPMNGHQGDTSLQEITCQIGQLTPAEGILFIEVQKSRGGFDTDGLEIQCRLVNLESTTLAFHRVFTPVQEPQSNQDFEDLNTIISGLAMKFRDSLPLLTGTVLAREGQIIEVDLGSEKGALCGTCYNIFKADGQELLCRAIIREVARDTSRARVIEADMSRKIRAGCRVSTR